MSFTPCGRYLITIGGVRNLTISLFEVRKKEECMRLCRDECAENDGSFKISMKEEEFISVEFNPKNSL
jgi:hypothetical protein